MPGAEMFTILAVLEARDKISAALEKAQAKADEFSSSLQRMAGVAEEAGARTDESLLQTASGADALDLASARVEAAQAKVAAATREQAAAEEELLSVQRQVAAGEMDAAEATDKQAAALARLQAAERDTAAASKEASTAQKLQADTAEASAAKTDAASAAQGRFGGAVAKGSGAMDTATKVALGAGVAVAAIGYESVKAATSFQTLTTRLVTSAGESSSNLNMIRQGILNISTATGSSANSLAQSMYTVESAGYHGADGLKVLKAATEGAKDEGADFATVSNGVTDALKDFHLSADQSANVTSQLVTAVSYGKTSFQDFSKALSNVLPLAGSMHLKLSDVSGVLAEMTSHGVTAQRASQNMANAMRSLENPTSVMTKEFKAVGISSQDVQQHLSSQGLGGTMQWLSGLAQENAARLGQTYPAALAKLMGTSAGLNVALMTTGENAKDTSTAIKGIAGASADAQGNVDGFSKIQQTLAFKMDQAKNAIHNTGIAIGTALLPLVTQLLGAVNKILVPVTNWIEKHQKLVALILVSVGAMAAAAGAIKLVSVAMGILNAVMDANPVSLIIIAIAALVAGLIYAWGHFQTFRTIVMAVFDAVKIAAMAVWHGLQAAWNGISSGAMALWHGLQAVWNGVVAGVMALWHGIESVWNAIASVTSTVWNGIKGFFEKWWPLLLVIFAAPIALLVGIWNHFHSEIEDTAKSVWNGIASFFSAIWDGIKAVATSLWDAIKAAVIQPMEAAYNALRPLWSAIGSFLSSVWSGIKSVASALWNAIKAAMITPLEDAWHTITSVVGNIASAIWNGLVGAWHAVENIGSQFLSIGSDIVNGIINGVEGAAGSLFSSLENLAQGALNAAKSFLGIGSPSKEFAKQVGQWIPHGVAQGVGEYAGVAQAAVGKMVKSLPSTATMSLTATGPAGISGGGVAYTGAGVAGGGTVINLDLRGSQVMSDRDMDQLVNKIGSRLATTLLPAGGVRIRA